MEQRTIPGTDLQVSVLALGCNAFGSRADAAAAQAIVDRALDAGITLIDTADIYSDTRSEQIVGEALRGRRDRVVLTTKGGGGPGNKLAPRGASRAHLTAALEASLRRLQTDYVDLYYVHYFDPETSDEETFGTLEELRRAGKIRAVGVSNYAGWQICRTLWSSERAGLVRVRAVQASYSLMDRTAEQELLPLCADQQLGFFPFWPLGGGLLSGKYRPGEPPPPGSRVLTQALFAHSLTPERLALAARVGALAAELGATPAQLALAWVLARPGVTAVLNGATKVAQLEDNLGALELRLEPALDQELSALSASAVRTPFR